MTLENLKDLYVEQLRDLHSAEVQLINALPKMAEQATHGELKNAFNEHLEQTRTHRERLEQAFKGLGEKPGGEKCKAMEGLIKEAKEIMKKDAEPAVKDAALIASAQRVEHYEIAGYGTVATYAERLGRTDQKDLLGQTLSEEEATDEKHTQIAEEVVNPEAPAA